MKHVENNHCLACALSCTHIAAVEGYIAMFSHGYTWETLGAHRGHTWENFSSLDLLTHRVWLLTASGYTPRQTWHFTHLFWEIHA